MVGEEYPRADRAAQVDDLIKNRTASKSSGEGAGNVLKLLGTQASSRDVFGIFEDCEGGDAQTFTRGTQAAAETGLLPPTVRNAMIREMFGETAMGMKCLSDQGLAHNDFKPPNVFLTKDGTVKVADLGDVAPVDSKGEAPAGTLAGSAAYEPARSSRNPPEQASLQRDIGMMGTFLDMLAGDVEELVGGRRQRPGGAGALHRLRDAMVDPDPKKRPTIDAVLQSSYVDLDPEEQASASDLAEVKKAVIAYSRKVAEQIGDPLKEIPTARQAINDSWRSGYKDDDEYRKHVSTLERQNAIIARQQKVIAQINRQQDIESLVEKIRETSTAVEFPKSAGPEAKWKPPAERE